MRFKDELQRQLYYRGIIDYCYWEIQEISNHTGKLQSPLEAMIDRATGFDIKKTVEKIDNIKDFVSMIIRCKKKIGYDLKNDKEFLKKLKSIIEQRKADIKPMI